LHLQKVKDGETLNLISCPATFFDIGSTKAKQYGFTMQLPSGGLCFAGDEPLDESCYPYAKDAAWLLHEAFCLYEERDIFKPYQKSHTTVKEACEIAETLGVKNLILYHTEDKNIANRKALYTAEGRQYYSGNLLVPDDLDQIPL
jgi:ribonuclease Z